MDENGVDDAQVELRVYVTSEGRVKVSGPIDNEMLCLWLLRKAERAVEKHNAAPKSGLVMGRALPRM